MKRQFLNTTELTSFKKRRKSVSKLIQLHFGSAAIYLNRETRFEPIYFSIFRKWLKIYLNFKKYPFFKNSVWVNIAYNFPISKKSKNARMGKGKGSFFRWSIRLPRNHVIIELRTLNEFRAAFFVNKLRYKISFLKFYQNK